VNTPICLHDMHSDKLTLVRNVVSSVDCIALSDVIVSAGWPWEPAAEGDIQMEYFSHYFCTPS
jgi:hypothetical protein